jgi:hypothetical protein
MRASTKHRIKNLLYGVLLLVGIFLFVPSPLCIIPRLCGGLVISWGYAETYLNIPGFLGLMFAGTWILGIVSGLFLVFSSMWPVKYETRPCPTCNNQTEQFQSKVNYLKGFKFKLGTPKAETDANILSYEYTCERCGKRNVEVKSLDQKPAKYGVCPICRKSTRQVISPSVQLYGLGGGWPCRQLTCEDCGSVLYDYVKGSPEPVSFTIPLCSTCGQPMDLRDPSKLTWFCRKDDTTFATTGPGAQEIVPPTMKERKQEAGLQREPPKLTSTIYCRECGAKIPRVNRFCGKCGAQLDYAVPTETQVSRPLQDVEEGRKRFESGVKTVVPSAVSSPPTIRPSLVSRKKAWLAFLLVALAVGSASFSGWSLSRPSLRVEGVSMTWSGAGQGQFVLVIEGSGTFRIQTITVVGFLLPPAVVNQMVPTDSKRLPITVTLMIVSKPGTPQPAWLIVNVEGAWTFIGIETPVKLTVEEKILWSRVS